MSAQLNVYNSFKKIEIQMQIHGQKYRSKTNAARIKMSRTSCQLLRHAVKKDTYQ